MDYLNQFFLILSLSPLGHESFSTLDTRAQPVPFEAALGTFFLYRPLELLSSILTYIDIISNISNAYYQFYV